MRNRFSKILPPGDVQRLDDRKLAVNFADILPPLLLLIALFLRMQGLGRQSLWNDEMFTLKLISLPWGEFLGRVMKHTAHPPLFFVIEKVVTMFTGTSEAGLRFLPALFGAATVPILYFFLREMWSKEAAIIAGALMTLSPYHLAYSQEARPYSLAMFFATLATLILFRICTQGQSINGNASPAEKKLFLALMLVDLAGLYTHYWYAFVVASHFVAVLLIPSLRVRWRWFLAIWLVDGMFFLPQLFFAFSHAGKVASANWWWVEKPSLLNPFRTFLAFTGVRFSQASATFAMPLWVTIVGASIAGFALLLLFIHGLSFRKEMNATLVSLLLLPPTIGFLISLYRPEVYVWYRYPSVVLPLFFAAVGVGYSFLRPSISRWFLVALLLGTQAMGVLKYSSWDKANPKYVAAFVTSLDLGKGDVLIRPWYFADLLNYYYRSAVTQLEEADGIDKLEPMIRKSKRVVLITLDIHNDLRDWMATHYDQLEEKHFPGESHMGILVDVYRGGVPRDIPNHADR
ncbi:MAG: glycosyltransferase family 39 protein [Bacteroidota bacterium]